jgi:hypothetical protein
MKEAERRKARTHYQPRHTFRRYRLKVLRARRAPHRRMLPSESASGALAFRRSVAALVAGRTLTTRSRPRFTRRGGNGRYPRRSSRLSQAPGAPVVMPAGTMPGPPGSGLRDRPREPHSLHLSDRIRNVPFSERAETPLPYLRQKSIYYLCTRDKRLVFQVFQGIRDRVPTPKIVTLSMICESNRHGRPRPACGPQRRNHVAHCPSGLFGGAKARPFTSLCRLTFKPGLGLSNMHDPLAHGSLENQKPTMSSSLQRSSAFWRKGKPTAPGIRAQTSAHHRRSRLQNRWDRKIAASSAASI